MAAPYVVNPVGTAPTCPVAESHKGHFLATTNVVTEITDVHALRTVKVELTTDDLQRLKQEGLRIMIEIQAGE